MTISEAFGLTMEEVIHAASETAEQLPKREEWPTVIDTPKKAEQVIALFEQSQELSSQIGSDLAIETERTKNNYGKLFRTMAADGTPIEMQRIPLSSLPTFGSRGSRDRQYFIQGAIARYGHEQAFDRLPPIIITDTNVMYNGIGQGDYEARGVFDGFTRCMVAYESGLDYIDAYVIPNEALKRHPEIRALN